MMVVAFGLVLLGGAACGDEKPADTGNVDTSNPDPGTGKQPMLTFTFDVSGVVPFKGDAQTLLPSLAGKQPASCAEYVKGVNGELPLPRMFINKVSDQTLGMGITLLDYTGPGNYGRDAIEKLPGGTESNVLSGVPGGAFKLNASSTSAIVIEAGGGGSWTFTDIAKSDGGKVSGKVTWKCTG
jgi:hypothetical protein